MELKLRHARRALDGAASENIVELCQQYLALLGEYRCALRKLPDTLDLNPRSKSSSSREAIDAARKAVRAAIEHTTLERNRAEGLILSFTAVSGYGAVETLNRQKYMGRDDWELGAGVVGFNDGTGGKRIMTTQEAVEIASLLRREEQVANNP
ncbi:MAG: hypothetical protein ACRD68_15315, partial [Pyrinomonadaceae bacterium]